MKNEQLTALALKTELARANKVISDKQTLDLLAKAKYYCEKGNEIDTVLPVIEGESEVQDYLRHAEILVNSGCPMEAELLLMAVAILSPIRSGAVAKLAALHEAQTAYSRTVSFTQQLLEEKGPDTEVAYQLSFALYKMGRPDEALEYILPYHIFDPSQRIARLCGLLLKSLGKLGEAIDALTAALELNPKDSYTLRPLAEIYANIGMYEQSLETQRKIPEELREDSDRAHESIVYRLMGELDRAIECGNKARKQDPNSTNTLWVQCFNYSISSLLHSQDLLESSRLFWELTKRKQSSAHPIKHPSSKVRTDKLRVAILSSDIGDHVVSRFITPILRHYKKDKYHVTLLSTVRRFEEKAAEIATYADAAISLQGLNANEIHACIEEAQPDIIIETNGFTSNSGIALLSQRCAPVQCHYIGYHATTGLDTIDYFLGDAVTVPREFQSQYTEKLVQIPSLWMAYDATIEFPPAASTAQRDCLVMGCFSQVAKINQSTLEYWAAAMTAAPESVLVIKDKGLNCQSTCKRIVHSLEALGVNPDRIYLFGPVASHFEHLDAYNAIDVALDTTPWSGATTAFEALGMGVPLIAICGDTTSGRMSTSVVSAAGMSHLIAHSKDDFGRIASELAQDYQKIRKNKTALQQQVRSGVLFDEGRICRDFFKTIDQLYPDQHNLPAAN